MKKIVSVLLTICIVISAFSAGLVVSFAVGTKIDGTDVTWSYDSDTKVLTFSGEGAIPDYNEYKNASGDLSLKYPWKNLAYTSIVFGKKITGIGNYAFCYSKALKEITIPETIAIMGKGIFLNCSKLETATIETTASSIRTNTFAGCSVLKTVTVAKGPKSIESKAFYNCSALEEIKLPSGVTSIGNEAFYQCVKLGTVEFSEVKTIGTYAFYGCEALKKLNLGKKLQTIGGNAFDSCTALEKLVIPSTVTTISSEAFSGCSLLKEVILPEDISTIGERAFNPCPLLTEITVSANVETIGAKALGYGKRGAKIDDFTIHGFENTKAQAYASENGFKFDSLGNYYFGECGENAKWEFDPATGILKISGTGKMQDYTAKDAPAYSRFAGKITNIKFDSGITSIGAYAFYNISPDGMLVPQTITSIGEKAIGQFSNDILKKDFRIQGYAYSAAQKYAKSMDMKFVNLTPYNGSCGENATWKFDEKAKTLTISGTGAMADFGQTTLKEYRKYGFDVKKIVVEDGITYIGNYAFVFDNSVEEIIFPESVENIGKNAFGYISYVKEGENKIKRDTELKVYGYNATPVKVYAESKSLKYISLDPQEIPEFNIDESVVTKIDREKKIIYLGQTEMTSDDFIKKFPTELFTSVSVSTDVIGTGSTLELTLGETTKESYTFIVLGDINGDGIVNSMDALEILNHSVEIQLLTGNALIAGDISGEGTINSNDALLVLNISVGNESIASFVK